MSDPIIIQGFHGGQAVDPYDPISKQTYQNSHDLDVFVDSNVLTPVALKLQTMAIPTISGGSSIIVDNSYLASNGKYYFAGQAVISAALNFVLWSTSTLDASPTYSADYNTATATPLSFLEEYKDGMFFGYGTNLDRWGDLSGSPSRTNIGTVTTNLTYLRAHRGLGKLFFAHNSGHTIGSYDNTTFAATVLTLDKDDTVVGIEEYGRWVALAIKGTGSKRSRFLLWDGSSTTIDDAINIDDLNLQGFKIVNGVFTYISLTSNLQNDWLRLSTVVPGGKPTVIREQQVHLTSGGNSVNTNAFSTFGDLFLWGLNGVAYSDLDLGIFGYGSSSNRLAKYYALWRLVSTGVTSNLSIKSIKHNGGSLIVIWGTTTGGGGTQHIDTITGNSLTLGVPSTGDYESNIFPLNGGLKGTIKKITINHKPLPDNCGFTVQIKHFGNYQWSTSVASLETYQTLFTPQGNASTSGMTQSTSNSVFTEIQNTTLFKEASYAQIKILFDEVSTTNAASIILPIIIEMV